MIGFSEVLIMAGTMAIIGLVFGFPLWCLIDVLKNEFTGNNKIIWLLVSLFVPVVGPVLYTVIGKKHRLVQTEWPVWGVVACVCLPMVPYLIYVFSMFNALSRATANTPEIKTLF